MAGTGNSSIRSYTMSEATTAAAGAFVEFPFIDENDSTPFISTGILIANDGAGGLEFSFDPNGVRLDGEVFANEQISFDFRKVRTIWVRGKGAATPAFRLWIW